MLCRKNYYVEIWTLNQRIGQYAKNQTSCYKFGHRAEMIRYYTGRLDVMVKLTYWWNDQYTKGNDDILEVQVEYQKIGRYVGRVYNVSKAS